MIDVDCLFRLWPLAVTFCVIYLGIWIGWRLDL
jgi:hypothetical protein